MRRPAATPIGQFPSVRTLADRALTFARLSPFGRPTLLNGAAGVVLAPGGRPVSVMGFAITRGKVVAIDGVADPERLCRLDLAVLND